MKSTSLVLGPSFAMMLMSTLFGGCTVDASPDASDESEASYEEEEETGTSQLAILNCATSYTHPQATKVLQVSPQGTNYFLGQQANGTIYQLWSNGVGTGSMTLYNDLSTFKATWNNPSSTWSNFLGRIGPKLLSTDPAAFQTLLVGYKVNLSVQSGPSMVGIYGWSKNVGVSDPLREIYIIDNWTGTRPSTSDHWGTFSVDGGTYDIYKNKQVDKPSIEGNTTFWQYFSVRQAKRSCGHINILAHFNKWQSLGFQLGQLNQINLLAESHSANSVGSADFQYANFAQALK